MQVRMDISTRTFELWFEWQRRLGKVPEDAELKDAVKAMIELFLHERGEEMRAELASAGVRDFNDFGPAIRRVLELTNEDQISTTTVPPSALSSDANRL
jgi:hypothetical protein